MARPSFRRCTLAGIFRRRNGNEMNLCPWRRSWQECLQPRRFRCVRRGRFAPAREARDGDRAGGEASALRGGDGGLLRRPSSRPRVRRSRPRRAADVARICPALRQGAEERRSRRRGDRGSGDAADDAVRRTEEPGPARYADASSIKRPVGRRTDGSDQSVARHSAGARNCRAAGQAEARAVPGRPDGRTRRSGLEPADDPAGRRRSRRNGPSSIDGSLPSTPSSSAG